LRPLLKAPKWKRAKKKKEKEKEKASRRRRIYKALY
jgi:hypothetical protein